MVTLLSVTAIVAGAVGGFLISAAVGCFVVAGLCILLLLLIVFSEDEGVEVAEAQGERRVIDLGEEQ